jgi:hypothetical protein
MARHPSPAFAGASLLKRTKKYASLLQDWRASQPVGFADLFKRPPRRPAEAFFKAIQNLILTSSSGN